MKRNIIIAIIAVAVVIGLWFVLPHEPKFCFDFQRNTQYGDRALKNPINEGVQGPSGKMYYVPYINALQTALDKDGFYVDPYESTGGRVYFAAFFGPSTQVALKDFQKKYAIAVTGTVDDATSDKLRALYGCPVVTTATSTSPVATTTVR